MVGAKGFEPFYYSRRNVKRYLNVPFRINLLSLSASFLFVDHE
jgi:hypothetical protein